MRAARDGTGRFCALLLVVAREQAGVDGKKEAESTPRQKDFAGNWEYGRRPLKHRRRRRIAEVGAEHSVAPDEFRPTRLRKMPAPRESEASRAGWLGLVAEESSRIFPASRTESLAGSVD